MKFNEIIGFEKKDMMLVKFTKSEYVQDLLDGNLYMNNFNHFVEQEKNTKHKGQGDSYEGAYVTTFDSVDIYIEDDLVGSAESGSLFIRNQYANKIPLFSMSLLTSRDFEVIEEKESSVILKLGFIKEDIQRIKDDFRCDKVVFTFQYNEFLKRLQEASNKISMKCMYDFVQYVDFSILDKKRKERFDQGHLDFLFHKHHSLKHQREFRVILPDIQVEQNYSFRVGDLNEIFYVMDIDDFFSGMKLQLNIPAIQ
jgi:hypothetical protein